MALRIAATSRAFGALLFTLVAACGNLDPPVVRFEEPGASAELRMPRTLDVTVTPKANHPMIDHQGFGRAVALSGTHLAVADCTYCDQPRPHVDTFEIVNGVATFAAMLPADWTGGPEFGVRIALRGDLLAIGDPRDYDYMQPGHVHPYRWDGMTWVAEPLLSSPTPTGASRYGGALAMAGNRLVVGAPGECRQLDDGTWTHETGAAYVYRRTGTGWVLDATLLAETEYQPHEFFGADVAISSSRIAVAAPSHVGAWPLDGGAVHVFEITPGAYLHSGDVSIPAERPRRVEVCSDHVLVAPEWGTAGVHVFGASEAGWVHEGHLQLPETLPGGAYAEALSCDSGTVLVGNPYVGPSEWEWVGEARLYRHGAGGFALKAVIPGAEPGDWAGYGVAADGGIVAVGTPFADVNGTEVGKVRVLRP